MFPVMPGLPIALLAANAALLALIYRQLKAVTGANSASRAVPCRARQEEDL